MAQIFQDIWDADQRGNGIPALRTHEMRDHTRGFVIVDERAADVDAEFRVLSEVHLPESKRTTYRLCETLFDNYALERAARENVRPGEPEEELAFIDAILTTPPIQTAREFLETSLNMPISDANLSGMIWETWFSMGRAGNQPDASGFEHVFVGEQGSRSTKAGGYHFWYKYWLDDGGKNTEGIAFDDRISYLGTQYGGAETPEKGILVPDVVTLELKWEAPLGDLQHTGPQDSKLLHKPIGGFFVGCSPEGLIALGLVRARTQSSKRTNINGSHYQLDLHRLNENRNAIRTFFPRFISSDVIDIRPGDGNGSGGTDDDVITPPGGEVPTTAPFRIIAGMINPENPEGGREFLQILNISDTPQSLLGWQIVAPNRTRFTLADTSVAPGDVFKFVVPSNVGVLRNKAGVIKLLDPSDTLVQSCPYTLEQARQEGKPILF